MAKNRSFYALLAIIPFQVAAAQPIKRAESPALSPNGSQLVFSWQGDLWLVGAEGGMASRLTVHPAKDFFPRWSPDGSRIVFSANRYGSLDIFTIRPDGKELRRLSFESSDEYPTAISSDGKWVYGYTNAWGRLDAFRLPMAGGDLVRLAGHPLELKYWPSVSPDGNTIALSIGGSPGLWRKAQNKGSNTSQIWLADAGVPLRNIRNITQSEFNEFNPNYLQDGTLLYVSNRSGWPNIWRMMPSSSSGRAAQITQHAGSTIHNLSVSANGKRAVYEFESGIHLLDLANGKTREVMIEVPGDQRNNPVADITMTSGVREFAVSPDAKRIVLELRGDLYLIPEKGGTTRRLTTNPGRDAQPVWLDPRTILYVAGGVDGKRELRAASIDGQDKVFLSESRDLISPSLSPDGKTLVFQRGHDELVTMPAKGGPVKSLVTGYFQDALEGENFYGWSPDSKWLVVNKFNERGTFVSVIQVETGKEIRIATTPRYANTPNFLPNSKGVFFTLREGEDSDIYVVDLIPQELSFTEDDLDAIDDTKKKPESKEVVVVEKGIEERMRKITSGGSIALAASADGKTIWALVNGQLTAVPVGRGTPTPVEAVKGPVSQVVMRPQKAYFVSAGKLFGLGLGGPPAPPMPIAFSANAQIDLRQEEKALFDDIWWAIDRLYYDEKHHGKDWKTIKQKYARLVPHAYDRSDFYALMGEMMEELESSHLGASPPAGERDPSADNTGYLGVEWDWQVLDTRGQYVVAAVFDGAPASHPQSELHKGDRLLEVDGEKPSAQKPLAALLNKKSGRKVKLSIERAGKAIEVLIKPDPYLSRSEVAYQNWVRWQREQTEKLSGGQLTYLHIRSMDDPSYELFLRQVRTLALGKKGVLIDVRFNGGGFTAHKILGILIKTPWLQRTVRGLPGMKVSENAWRGDALELPTALLINQYSFSNAEIFAEGFRRLKLGPIIGEQTAGGVIGTGAYLLWDGGMIRTPVIGAYAIDGQNLERHGRKADVEVKFDPNAWQAGRDLQLEKAVQVLLGRLPK